jgi:2-polyprenyl-3-methyl-5-hydroxy-6-metoxy-1,4-benzoquinol methylase
MNTSCPHCRTDSRLCFRSRDYNRRTTPEIFDHHRCPRCGVIFIDPVPADLHAYYPDEYHAVPATLATVEALSATDQYKIENIQRYVREGRLLEIGPSFGGFAYRAKQAGFETEAIEMDARCSAFLNDVLQVPTVNTIDIGAALNTLKPFDVVAMWHVIEHLPNPWEILEAVSRKINAGGVLVLAAPNPGSLQFRVLGRRWPHLDAPRHLMLIPAQVLIDKMATLGMKTELVTTTDEGARACDLFGWVSFFSSLWRPPGMVNRELRKFGHRFTRLVAPIEKREGNGSAYTLVFRKVA